MELKRKEVSLGNIEEDLKRQEADIQSKVKDLEYREMVWRNVRWEVDVELEQGRKDLLMKEKHIKRRNKNLNQREARVKIKEEVSKVVYEVHYNKAMELDDRETDLNYKQGELDETEEQLSLEWKNASTIVEVFENYSGGF